MAQISVELIFAIDCSKIADFAELIFVNSLLVVKYAEFIFAIGDQEEHFKSRWTRKNTSK